jgi:hypothetical protein
MFEGRTDVPAWVSDNSSPEGKCRLEGELIERIVQIRARAMLRARAHASLLQGRCSRPVSYKRWQYLSDVARTITRPHAAAGGRHSSLLPPLLGTCSVGHVTGGQCVLGSSAGSIGGNQATAVDRCRSLAPRWRLGADRLAAATHARQKANTRELAGRLRADRRKRLVPRRRATSPGVQELRAVHRRCARTHKCTTPPACDLGQRQHGPRARRLAWLACRGDWGWGMGGKGGAPQSPIPDARPCSSTSLLSPTRLGL